jgi:hypothetical protein
LGSKKVDTSRVKIYHETFTIHKQEYKHEYVELIDNDVHKTNLQLEESLITLIHRCRPLSIYLSTNLSNNIKNTDINPIKNTDINTKESTTTNETITLTKSHTVNKEDDENICMKALELYGRYLKMDLRDKNFPVELRSDTLIKDSIVSLKRVCPNFCEMCNRLHENRDPFIVIHNGNAYYYCGRNKQYNPTGQSKRIHLGRVTETYQAVNLSTLPEYIQNIIGKLSPPIQSRPNNMGSNNMGSNNMGSNNMDSNNMGSNNMGFNNMDSNNMDYTNVLNLIQHKSSEENTKQDSKDYSKEDSEEESDTYTKEDKEESKINVFEKLNRIQNIQNVPKQIIKKPNKNLQQKKFEIPEDALSAFMN